MLLTLALMTILLTAVALWARRCRSRGASPRRLRRLEPALAVAIGLALTLFAGWTANECECRNHARSFRNLAASKTAGVVETLHDLRDGTLEGLRGTTRATRMSPRRSFNSTPSI